MDPKEMPPGLSKEDMARAVAGEGVRFEYEILRATAKADGNAVVIGVKGIEDDKLVSMARQGWRAISFSWQGRKLLAVVFERPAKGR